MHLRRTRSVAESLAEETTALVKQLADAARQPADGYALWRDALEARVVTLLQVAPGALAEPMRMLGDALRPDVAGDSPDPRTLLSGEDFAALHLLWRSAARPAADVDDAWLIWLAVERHTVDLGGPPQSVPADGRRPATRVAGLAELLLKRTWAASVGDAKTEFGWCETFEHHLRAALRESDRPALSLLVAAGAPGARPWTPWYVNQAEWRSWRLDKVARGEQLATGRLARWAIDPGRDSSAQACLEAWQRHQSPGQRTKRPAAVSAWRQLPAPAHRVWPVQVRRSSPVPVAAPKHARRPTA